ncbi:MAG: FAD-binding and (Fe-S)-binding domain-containing protein [Gemmataceae bacterium]
MTAEPARIGLDVLAAQGAGGIDAPRLQAELSESIRGEVRFDRLSRALYSTDASVYQIVPLGVVIPRSQEDILKALEICRRHQVPITARGGGTSQAGQSIGTGVQIDCSKYFNQILEINAAERWVRVQPGCVLDELNAALKPHGLQFPIDISTSNRATLGGMIANNSSGTRSVLYGKTGDHVLELKAVLADGTILHLGPMDAAELEKKCAGNERAAALLRFIRALGREHADEIQQRFPNILRRVGGYNLVPFANPAGNFDLTPLLIGSEGTLAFTLEAKLKLSPLPKHKAVLVVQFGDLLDALAATPACLEHGPSAVEVIDRYVLDSTRINPDASRLRGFLQGDPAAILIIEFYGDTADELPAKLAGLEKHLQERGHGHHFHRALDAAAQGKIWKLRKLSLGLSMAEKGDAKAISFVEDTAVSPDRLRDFIAEFLEVIARHGTRAGVYAHASVGCLHVRPVINLKTIEGITQFEAIANDVADLVLKYGGALSGEHGDGLVRSPFQERMYGPAIYQAFRKIKQTFDPDNLLNPGKIVDAPPQASSLRYGASYVTPELETTFDFSVDGGLVRAAELCAGVGECRKNREGAMCPSYRATREEQHSTRGRANTLRLALTGQLGLNGLDDPAVKDVLDLCLECKACKSECPTNVDMARLKAEFLHQHQRRHGLPWRNRMFGQIARVAKWGSRLAPVSNWLARNPLARWLNDKLFGIEGKRKPPAFARRTFVSQYASAWVQRPELRPWRLDDAPTMLLFPDTFGNHFEPELMWDALELLRATGARVAVGWPESEHILALELEIVHLILESEASLPREQVEERAEKLRSQFPVGLKCCGRPLISNGLLDQAVAHAEHNVELLFPWAVAGKPIVACEPSCLLTIKDDYPALLRGAEREQAEAVAQQCRTFEEVLLERAPAFQQHAGKILVQPHCHQRSLVGPEPLVQLLRRIPGAEILDPDAGCCGMAGSFGYEKEHYELSRAVGAHQLFPAIAAAGADVTVVAPGFSCRLQIEHFTGQAALHPAQLLRELIDSGAADSET